MQAIERYMKQAIVARNPTVASAALVSSLVSEGGGGGGGRRSGGGRGEREGGSCDDHSSCSTCLGRALERLSSAG